MRTHYLTDLNIKAKERALAKDPTFDFYNLQRVLGLTIEFPLVDADDFSLLLVTAEYRRGNQRFKLRMQFTGIRQLILPEMSPHLFFAELEIEDVKAQMIEGIAFQVISQYDKSFRCLCKEIEIIDFEPI